MKARAVKNLNGGSYLWFAEVDGNLYPIKSLVDIKYLEQNYGEGKIIDGATVTNRANEKVFLLTPLPPPSPATEKKYSKEDLFQAWNDGAMAERCGCGSFDIFFNHL